MSAADYQDPQYSDFGYSESGLPELRFEAQQKERQVIFDALRKLMEEGRRGSAGPVESEAANAE